MFANSCLRDLFLQMGLKYGNIFKFIKLYKHVHAPMEPRHGNNELCNLVCYFVCGRVPWLNQYWPGGFVVFVVLCPGTPEGSTGSDSGFKASQKTGQRLKVSSDRLGEAGNRTCDPWFTRHRFIPYTTAAHFAAFLFPGL